MSADGELFCEFEAQVHAITGYTKVSRIMKGFSFEQKYVLSGEGMSPYLLRIARTPLPQDIRRKQEEYNTLSRLMKYSSLVPGTHAFGTNDDKSVCYMLLSYFDGRDAEEVLCTLDEDDQYRLGLGAGRELYRLHCLEAPEASPEWAGAVSAKFNRKLRVLQEMGIGNPDINIPALAACIRKKLPCIRNARQSFLHDDYHPANLIVRDGKLSGIIDFNRYDWGDPVHDFVKLAYFSRASSIPFSAGQIDGYHGGLPPTEFWQRYSVYCAMTVVADLLWSHMYEEKSRSKGEVERALERIGMVCSDHDNFTSPVPAWYTGYCRPDPVS